MNKIQQIEHAIAQAELEQSKLSPDVLALEGMNSAKVRHLLNNLGAISTYHLEIGSWKGASLVSTLAGNPHLSSVSIENFGEFNPEGDVKNLLLTNVAKMVPTNQWALLDQDCFVVERLSIQPDLYFFDGAHDEESHQKAITRFFPMMADEALFIVDDYSHPDFHAVKSGTLAGLQEVKDRYEVIKQWELWEEGEGSVRWWNGLLVALIKRK